MNFADLRVKTKLMLGFAFLAAIKQQAAGLLGLVAAFKIADAHGAAFA